MDLLNYLLVGFDWDAIGWIANVMNEYAAHIIGGYVYHFVTRTKPKFYNGSGPIVHLLVLQKLPLNPYFSKI